ncbi:alpha/beta hydrolase [Actinomadura rudentiformis]|uniref:Alpha/beta hydrolase n=1 Tax=Actinomadura rudentiformis TaxID=359158 RepID=A0A6H9Z224_9ACTN|nr:alpha/beta hydrolase [Actinomadura rudentiformis]KAB2348316.1 alpha/beta hydrolase [Actinomadura rudentiformis]
MPKARQAWRRAVIWSTGAAAVITTGVVVSPASGAAPEVNATAVAATTGVQWSSCKPPDDPKWEAWKGAECATLRLPIDWARPDGPKFDLAIARRQADAATRTGTLVFGPGGPGDSGVERVGTGLDRFSPEVRRRFDIVSFDPRGVGLSSPVTCTPALLAERPSPKMTSQADFESTIAYNKRLRDDCRANTKPAGIFDHLDSGQTVRDLEAIRVALGEKKLTFHGSSYGAMLGALYAETYPRNLRAMVLESVMDHSVPTTRAFLRDAAGSGQDLFDEFVKWCAGNAECALRDRDVRAVWTKLRAKADRGELATPPRLAGRLGSRLTSSDLVNMVAFRAFYGPDFALLAKDIVDMETREASGPPPKLSPLPPALPVFCSDWRLPVRNYREYASLVRTMNKTAPDMPYMMHLRMTASCLGAPTANPQHRLKPAARKAPTVLLVNAAHDPATPHKWAASVARQFGRKGVLVTYDGWGHGSATEGPCMENAVDGYLTDLKVPARGTHCPAA